MGNLSLELFGNVVNSNTLQNAEELQVYSLWTFNAKWISN
jgi:hypothetical protein